MKNYARLLLVTILFVGLAAGCKKCTPTEGTSAAALKIEDVYKSEAVSGYALFPDFSATAAKVEKLAALAGPVPPGAIQGMIVQGLLSLGLKDTSVVDLSKPAAVVFLDPKQYPAPLAGAVTTKGEDQVLAALQPAWKHQGEKEGVHELVREQVDTYGVFAGGGAKPPTVKESVFLSFSGKTAMFASDASALAASRPALQALLSAVEGDVFLGADLARLRRKFASEIDSVRQQIRQNISLDMARPGQIAGASTVAMAQKIADMFFSLFEQIDRVEVAATVDEKALHLETAMSPAPDSIFSRLLANQKKAPLKLLAALPQEHPIAMGINLQWDSLKPGLLEFSDEIFKLVSEKPLPAEAKELFKQMWELLGDEVVFSENIGRGISLVEAFAVKDEKKAREVFLKLFNLFSQLLKDFDFEGISFSIEGPHPSGISEAPTDLFQFKFAFKEENQEQAKIMAEVMKTMYGGDSLKMAMAFHSGAVILTMSPDPEKLMLETLQRFKSGSGGLATSASFRSASGPYLEKSGGFFYISIAKLMQEGVQAALAADGKAGDVQAANPAKSGLFLSGYSENGKFKIAMRLPADHLSEIGEALRGLMSSGMK